MSTAKEIAEAFQSSYDNDKVIQGILKKINQGTATYKNMQTYADRVGSIWSRMMTAAVDGIEEMTYQEAEALIKPGLVSMCSDVLDRSQSVQTSLNRRAGISFKAIRPADNPDRINNLIYKLAGGEGSLISDTKWLLGKDVLSNMAQSSVTDSIESNAEFQSDAGLPAYIERDSGGGCCAWCDSMAGRYVYGQQPSDFFCMHKDCTCSITYEPSKSRKQRISYKTDENGKMHRVIE